jgi:hypothetical protein
MNFLFLSSALFKDFGGADSGIASFREHDSVFSEKWEKVHMEEPRVQGPWETCIIRENHKKRNPPLSFPTYFV